MVDDRKLMKQIEQFAMANANIISIHAENSRLEEGLALISSLSCAVGIVLRLKQKVIRAAPFLKQISMLTLLGTKIGIKGAELDPQAERCECNKRAR